MLMSCKHCGSPPQTRPVTALTRGLEILVDEATEDRSARMRVRRCAKASEIFEVFEIFGGKNGENSWDNQQMLLRPIGSVRFNEIQ